jgi:F420H(2)-dependent quinone reductase
MASAADSPSRSHAPFALWNRVVNPVVKTLLRSPAHRLVSGRLALITVTGKKSGRAYTFPVDHERDGDHVTITVGWPERKRWWRNLRGGGSVSLVLGGVERTGQAIARGDERSGVTVDVHLDPLEKG